MASALVRIERLGSLVLPRETTGADRDAVARLVTCAFAGARSALAGALATIAITMSPSTMSLFLVQPDHASAEASGLTSVRDSEQC
jgi:hypothetical protein